LLAAGTTSQLRLQRPGIEDLDAQNPIEVIRVDVGPELRFHGKRRTVTGTNDVCLDHIEIPGGLKVYVSRIGGVVEAKSAPRAPLGP
jgi:hypothetical protein